MSRSRAGASLYADARSSLLLPLPLAAALDPQLALDPAIGCQRGEHHRHDEPERVVHRHRHHVAGEGAGAAAEVLRHAHDVRPPNESVDRVDLRWIATGSPSAASPPREYSARPVTQR